MPAVQKRISADTSLEPPAPGDEKMLCGGGADTIQRTQAMDDDEKKLKRSADELGIGLVDLETVEEQVEVIEHAGLRADLRTKGKLRRLIREEKKPPVFDVCARVKGALNSHGARGNVYKMLEEHNGSFSLPRGAASELRWWRPDHQSIV